jgi:hypothetical protein
MGVYLDPLAFIMHFASELCIASKLVCSLLEVKVGSLAVSSAKVADVVSGEIGGNSMT